MLPLLAVLVALPAACVPVTTRGVPGSETAVVLDAAAHTLPRARTVKPQALLRTEKRGEQVDKILVTGVAGFIGSHTALALLDRRLRVIGVDDMSRGHGEAIATLKEVGKEIDPVQPTFVFHKMDVGDDDAIQELMQREKPDAVIHFAGVTSAGESVDNPLKYYRNNTANSGALAAAMVTNGVRNLIFSSSCSVFGTPSVVPVAEGHPKRPSSPYAQSKYVTEVMLKDLWNSAPAKEVPFRVGVLRYFNVLGADPKGRLGERHQPDLKLGSELYRMNVRLPTALVDAAQGLTSMFKVNADQYNTTDRTAMRDYIHVSDVAEAHIAALDSLAKDAKYDSFREYNVGTGIPFSVKQVVAAVKKVTGVDFSVEFGQTASKGLPQIWSDNRKFKEEIGWTPKYTNLTQMIEHAWNFRHSDNVKIHRDGAKLEPFQAGSYKPLGELGKIKEMPDKIVPEVHNDPIKYTDPNDNYGTLKPFQPDSNLQEDDSQGLWDGEANINDEGGLTPLTLKSLHHRVSRSKL